MVHMRKGIGYIILALIIASCGTGNQTLETHRFTDSKSLVSFEFPNGWFKNPEENPWDLQCFSSSSRLNTGLFLYNLEDLVDKHSPRSLYSDLIEDMKSKRENFVLFENENTLALDSTKITSSTYKAEKDDTKNCYKFSLVEFKNNQNIALVVLQTGFPSEWEQKKGILEGILRTAELVKVQ